MIRVNSLRYWLESEKGSVSGLLEMGKRGCVEVDMVISGVTMSTLGTLGSRGRGAVVSLKRASCPEAAP